MSCLSNQGGIFTCIGIWVLNLNVEFEYWILNVEYLIWVLNFYIEFEASKGIKWGALLVLKDSFYAMMNKSGLAYLGEMLK